MSAATLTTYTVECTRPTASAAPCAYPGRDNARILRRARSIQRSERESFNMRANCCRKPKHRELPDVPAFTTECANCGATV